MHELHVPSRPALRQPPLAFIAILSCALSFWLTVRFCAQLCPGETAFELMAVGVLWEGSKVLFGTYGLHALSATPVGNRLRSGGLVVVSLVLGAGSIAASLGFLVQTDSHQRQTTLASSQAYRRAQAELTSINQQIQVLTSSAVQDVTQSFRTRGLRSVDKISALRRERDRVDMSLQRLETNPASDNSQFFVSIGGIFQGDATRNANRLRLGAQCILAVMLEVVSLIALAMLRTPFLLEPRDEVRSTDGTPRMGRRKRSASPMHLVDASSHASPARIQIDAKRRMHPEGRGDTAIDDTTKNNRYIRAKTLLQQSQMRPNYRAMQSTLDIGQGTARRYLQAMIDEGFLRKEGRRYCVAS